MSIRGLGSSREFLRLTKEKISVRNILIGGLILHFFLAAKPLMEEANLALREMPLLKESNNWGRLTCMFQGKLDSVEDYRFLSRCEKEIPPDAAVLVVSNSLTNVFTLNYYLYPRKVYSTADSIKSPYWVVHYFTPKALGLNTIEGPVTP
jgi:hypothetical protein